MTEAVNRKKIRAGARSAVALVEKALRSRRMEIARVEISSEGDMSLPFGAELQVEPTGHHRIAITIEVKPRRRPK